MGGLEKCQNNESKISKFVFCFLEHEISRINSGSKVLYVDMETNIGVGGVCRRPDYLVMRRNGSVEAGENRDFPLFVIEVKKSK